MWKKKSSKILLQHSRINIVEDDVQLPSGKVIQYLRYENTKNAACVVCFKGGKLLVQKEYSYPTNKILYQFPGGAIEKDESPEEAARRELHEESNLMAGDLTPLGYFYVDHRRSNAKMHVFLTHDAQNSEGQSDEEEVIITEWISTSEFQSMISSGKIYNSMTLAAWALYTAKH